MEVFHEFLLSIKLDFRFRLILSPDGERLHAENSRLDFLGIGKVRQMEKLELFRRVRTFQVLRGSSTLLMTMTGDQCFTKTRVGKIQ